MVKNAKPKKQAKTKAVQSASGKLKSIWHKKWQVILIAVVFVGILGFLGINQLIIYNQKQQFKAAEESLDAIYADIVKEIGQPTESTKEKFCSYRSQKIGRGDRSCKIYSTGKYHGIVDKNSAIEFTKKIRDALGDTPGVAITRVSSPEDSPLTASDKYQATDELKLLSSPIWCFASYDFDPTNPQSSKSFEFTLGCSDSAKAEYYPAKD